MFWSSLHFLFFALVAAGGAGAILRHFKGKRAGWIAGVSVLLFFLLLYAVLYRFVLVPLQDLG
ncbi:MAG: hypothetical protein R3234_02855 [Thermoanaerobaculia bacterium]|nr:hypothetical protein [Thermoanaerobaculia bacterium]